MDAVSERAYAKLNLSLDVTGKLKNGYHSMRMVMQTVSLCDDLRVELTEDGRVTAESGLRYLPRDERNLAARAARLYLDRAGMPEKGARIELTKRIPVGAGLGGGSSDAAAVLRAMQKLTGADFSRKELEAMGGELGSDVPFCVAGGASLAEGRGDELTDLPPAPDFYAVICKPPFPISTPTLFARLDGTPLRWHPDTDGLVAAMAGGDLAGMARRMYNVFEDVLPRKYGEVSVIKSRLLDLGAPGVVMSGTGSAVFGVFSSETEAQGAYEALRADYRECFLARPVGRLA